jgi:hypothetical protein
VDGFLMLAKLSSSLQSALAPHEIGFCLDAKPYRVDGSFLNLNRVVLNLRLEKF